MLAQYVRVSGLSIGELEKWLPRAKRSTGLLYSELTRLKSTTSKLKLVDSLAVHLRLDELAAAAAPAAKSTSAAGVKLPAASSDTPDPADGGLFRRLP